MLANMAPRIFCAWASLLKILSLRSGTEELILRPSSAKGPVQCQIKQYVSHISTFLDNSEKYLVSLVLNFSFLLLLTIGSYSIMSFSLIIVSLGFRLEIYRIKYEGILGFSFLLLFLYILSYLDIFSIM